MHLLLSYCVHALPTTVYMHFLLLRVHALTTTTVYMYRYIQCCCVCVYIHYYRIGKTFETNKSKCGSYSLISVQSTSAGTVTPYQEKKLTKKKLFLVRPQMVDLGPSCWPLS
jgi:hypothetical protein